MVNEMRNYAIVEGILSEIGIEKASFTDKKTGNLVACIRGDLKIRVNMPIVSGGEVKELEVPVRFFTKQYTNSGAEHPGYTGLMNIIEHGKSIAAVGLEQADAVRITGCKIAMQEYYTADGRFMTFPSINGSFVTVIKKEDMEPKAKAEVEIVVQQFKDIVDKEGLETGELQIIGAHVGYGEYTDLIPFTTSNPKYIAAIRAQYSEGDSMKIVAALNFSSRTEKFYEEVAIGDPIERTRTVNVSDLVIASIAPAEAMVNDINEAELRECLKKRDARIAALKDKAGQKKAAAPVAAKAKAAESKIDLGF